MKELEKIAKDNGISTMIVKDVVQEMLDEDMIIQEKVGTNMLYWIFPSQSYMLKKRKLDSLRKEAELARAEKAQLDESIAKAKASKPESEHRFELLRQYEEYKKKEETLQSQLDSMKERDPETIRMMKDDVKRAVEGANRWTDNIWSMKSFLVRKQGISSKEADQALEIPDDFDYIELPPFLKS
ncbi:hypothetical protein JH06_5201 [Blastocystis sp. subtype 4]|uniref:hypothetical protein n=1 Tax=Blastocystis sp. subtype 4 TaxID=944170 RepID=UPI000711BD96|nr:hypothetical protein JH06_5201 [Blastocystis sp. subtype 4]KNB41425.1 hypothetical protein JH06_5201 [Blastocystis sp. subtype 4]|eukprot:XP_014524868.1 hypothetical protein JH06_5201 [Blastocystis sp. subtype 4]